MYDIVAKHLDAAILGMGPYSSVDPLEGMLTVPVENKKLKKK